MMCKKIYTLCNISFFVMHRDKIVHKMLNFVKVEQQKILTSMPLIDQASIISDEKEVIMPTTEKFLSTKFISQAKSKTILLPKKNLNGAYYENIWGYTKEALYVMILDEYVSSDEIMKIFGFEFRNLPEIEYLIAIVHQYCEKSKLSALITANAQSTSSDFSALDILSKLNLSKKSEASVKDSETEMFNKMGLIYSISMSIKQEIENLRDAFIFASEYNSPMLVKYIHDATVMNKLS